MEQIVRVHRLREDGRADIIVQLDLSGVENTSAVEPIILFPKSLQSLGAMGSYSVSVQVTPNETVSEE